MDQFLNFIKDGVFQEKSFIDYLKDHNINQNLKRNMILKIRAQNNFMDFKKNKSYSHFLFNGVYFEKWSVKNKILGWDDNLTFSPSFLKEIREIEISTYPDLDENNFLSLFEKNEIKNISCIITLESDIRLDLISYLDEKNNQFLFKTSNKVLSESLFSARNYNLYYKDFITHYKIALKENIYKKI